MCHRGERASPLRKRAAAGRTSLRNTAYSEDSSRMGSRSQHNQPGCWYMETEEPIRRPCEAWFRLLSAGSLQSPALSLTYMHMFIRGVGDRPLSRTSTLFDAHLSHSQTSQKMNKKIWKNPVSGGKPVSSSSSLWKQSELSRPHGLALATVAVVVVGRSCCSPFEGFCGLIFFSRRGKWTRQGEKAWAYGLYFLWVNGSSASSEAGRLGQFNP